VVWATGWRPYDAAKIQPYGYGRIPNVVTSLEFERMADPHGPTGGKLLRADGKEAKNVAFIQCAGSRDENHLRHCSRICCMASLKQTHYVREACGDEGKSTIYYIDIRAIDRFEDFYQSVQNDPDRHLRQVEGGAHRLNEPTGNPVLHGVDTEGYHRYATEHDLVVLAVGMEPETDRRQAARGHRARLVQLHRRLEERRHVRRRQRGQPARREPLGAERHRGQPEGDSSDPQDCFDGGRMNAPATPKYAAYICSGCGIGDKLDVGALEKIAQREGKMAVVKSHPFLCSAEGVQMIRTTSPTTA
jgi:heterodisulfide reductase subunit A-like polyferredoxin